MILLTVLMGEQNSSITLTKGTISSPRALLIKESTAKTVKIKISKDRKRLSVYGPYVPGKYSLSEYQKNHANYFVLNVRNNSLLDYSIFKAGAISQKIGYQRVKKSIFYPLTKKVSFIIRNHFVYEKDHYTVSSYSNKGFLIDRTKFNNSGEIEKLTYFHQQKGFPKKLTEKEYAGKTLIRNASYDESGSLEKELIFSKKGDLLSEEIHTETGSTKKTYKKGNLSGLKYFDIDNKLTKEILYAPKTKDVLRVKDYKKGALNKDSFFKPSSFPI